MRTATIVPAVLALAAHVSGHGHIYTITTSTGKSYEGVPQLWMTPRVRKAVVSPDWFTNTPDNGPVRPPAYDGPDIICHIDGKPGTVKVDVEAGTTLTLDWRFWKEGHHGAIFNYMAACKNGDCTKVDKTTLKFFKISERAMIRDEGFTGYWATDEMIDNSPPGKMLTEVQIPDYLEGEYVLRHEILSLHEARAQDGGAQAWPQCINLRITNKSGGTKDPCGAGNTACVPATSFYEQGGPGIEYSIFDMGGKNGGREPYPIPGPPLFEYKG